jgi:hypothetical protein
VVADGRVLFAGGEYNFGSTADLCAAEIYDPLRDQWSSIGTPAGWTKIGDAASCMLPDGRLLLGSIEGPDCAIFDPTAESWSGAGAKLHGTSDEESWTLLPDGSVITVDCFGSPATERFVDGSWRDEGTLADALADTSMEIGPALLLPDRRVLVIGATGRTALFSPGSDPTQLGTWRMGQPLPKNADGLDLVAKDAPACLLPNGRVLCAMGPMNPDPAKYDGPTTLAEFDPAVDRWNILPVPPANPDAPPYVRRLLLLPTGEVLFASEAPALSLYVPDGSPQDAWRPTITDVETSLVAGSSYRLTGLRLNGVSQGSAYGDDVAYATNYPLVRLRAATGLARYCRTFGHSTMGVATGETPVFTNFTSPNDAVGAFGLAVIANGISSAEISVTVVAGENPLPTTGPSV